MSPLWIYVDDSFLGFSGNDLTEHIHMKKVNEVKNLKVTFHI